MIAELLAFAFAAAFTGAAAYIGLVEQPARLTLDDRAMASEWKLSDRRGLLMLGILALTSAVFALAAYFRTKDAAWLIGGAFILGSWPYMFYVLVPLNNLLIREADAPQRSAPRQLMLDWGLLEWGLVANGLIATAMLGWALA